MQHYSTTQYLWKLNNQGGVTPSRDTEDTAFCTQVICHHLFIFYPLFSFVILCFHLFYKHRWCYHCLSFVLCPGDLLSLVIFYYHLFYPQVICQRFHYLFSFILSTGDLLSFVIICYYLLPLVIICSLPRWFVITFHCLYGFHIRA